MRRKNNIAPVIGLVIVIFIATIGGLYLWDKYKGKDLITGSVAPILTLTKPDGSEQVVNLSMLSVVLDGVKFTKLKLEWDVLVQAENEDGAVKFANTTNINEIRMKTRAWTEGDRVLLGSTDLTDLTFNLGDTYRTPALEITATQIESVLSDGTYTVGCYIDTSLEVTIGDQVYPKDAEAFVEISIVVRHGYTISVLLTPVGPTRI